MNACNWCGKELFGRADKRFCNAYCRNSYNNKSKKKDEEVIQNVNKVIRRNRKILKTLCPTGKLVVKKDVLDSVGYNYKYFSEMYKSDEGRYYFLCYDYGFTPISEDNKQDVMIVKRAEYMDDFVPELW